MAAAEYVAVPTPVPVRRAVLRDLATFTAVALAGMSAAAGGIHGAAMPEHAREHWSFGVFFAGSAAFQIVWAYLALRKLTPRLLQVGAVANAGFVLLWFVTRTVGVPVGPEPWTTEPAGFVDGVTVALEVAIVALAVRLARPGALGSLEGRTTPRPLYAIGAGAAALSIAALAAARNHADEVAKAGGPDHSRQLLTMAATGGLIYAVWLLHRARATRPDRVRGQRKAPARPSRSGPA